MSSHHAGLSSRDANIILKRTYVQIINKMERSYEFRGSVVLCEILKSWQLALLLLAGGFLFACHLIVRADTQSYLLQSIAIFACALVYVLVLLWKRYLETREIIKLLTTRMEKAWRRPQLSTMATEHPPKSAGTRVKRDGIWIYLPTNLLVKGDVIVLSVGDLAPCKLQHLRRVSAEDKTGAATTRAGRASSLTSYVLEFRQVQPPLGKIDETTPRFLRKDGLLLSDRIYEVLESPLIRQLEHIFRAYHANTAELRVNNEPLTPMSPSMNNDGLHHDSSGHNLASIVMTERRTTKAERVKLGKAQESNSSSSSSSTSTDDIEEKKRIAIENESSSDEEDDNAINLQDTEILKQYRARWRPMRPPITPYEKRIENVLSTLTLFGLFMLLVGLLISFARIYANTESYRWSSLGAMYEYILLNTTMLILPLLSLSTVCFLYMLDSIGNALLLSSYDIIQKDRIQLKAKPEVRPWAPRGPINIDDNRLDIDEEELEDVDVYATDEDGAGHYSHLDNIRLSWLVIWKRVYGLAVGNCHYLTRMVNPFQVLGTVSMFVCLDKEGILSENESSPEHILLLDEDDEQTTKPVVLDLLNSPDSPNGISFENDASQYEGQLKPLGLNCSVNTPCNLPRALQPQYEWGMGHYYRSQSSFDSCLCLLSREIGFNLNNVRAKYHVKKSLYNVNVQMKRKHQLLKKKGASTWLPVMSSVVVEDCMAPRDREKKTTTTKGIHAHSHHRSSDANISQLLSRGEPSLVMRYCDKCWTGHDVNPISQTLRNKIFEIVQQWRHQDLKCIAFSYTPLDHHDPLARDGDGINAMYLLSHLRLDHRQRSLRMHNHTSSHHSNRSESSLPTDSELATAASDTSMVLSPSMSNVHEGAEVNYPLAAPPDPSDEDDKEEEEEEEDVQMLVSPDEDDGKNVLRVHYDTKTTTTLSDVTATDGVAPTVLEEEQPRSPRKATRMPPRYARQKSNETKEKNHHQERNVPGKQVFLGLVAMCDQPKTEVISLVERLHTACIRFVLFSRHDALTTKAFGGRIGLFTDFNSYISLRDQGTGNGDDGKGKVRFVQGRSMLPRGVSGIRKHIKKVDNVPLLISLFTDCQVSSMKEMIKIYQENGHVVMCLGSSLKAANTDLFLQADMACAVDPLPPARCVFTTSPSTPHLAPEAQASGYSRTFRPYHESMEYTIAKILTSLPCVLPIGMNMDLRHLTALICEARRLSSVSNHSLTFALSCQLLVFLAIFLCSICDTPLPLSTFGILWLAWVIVPIMSLSLLTLPREEENMANVDLLATHKLITPNFITGYFLVRFGLSIVLICALHSYLWLYAIESDPHSALMNDFFWGAFKSSKPPDNKAILFSNVELREYFEKYQTTIQTYTLLVIVIMMSFHNFLFSNKPFWQPIWVGLHGVLVGGQCLWTFLSVENVFMSLPGWSSVEGIGLYILLLWPILIIVIASLRNKRDWTAMMRYRKKYRQQFNTVLGMHSPKGRFEN